MKKLKIVLLTILVLIALIVIGAGIFAATFNINSYRPQIEAYLKTKLQRDVSFQNNMEFHLFPNPVVKLSDVTIGNPAWAKTPYLAHVKTFDLKLLLTPLLSRQIVVDGVTIDGADINLEQQGDKKNWELGAPEKTEQAKDAPRNADPKKAFVPLGVSNAAVKNSVLRMINDGKQSEYTLQSLNFAWPPSKNAKIDFDVLLGKDKLSGSVKGGTLAEWHSTADFPIDIDITYSAFKVAAKAAIKGRTAIEQIKSTFDFSGADGLNSKGDATINFAADKTIRAGLHLTELVLANGVTAKPANGMEANSTPATPGTKILPATPLPRNLLLGMKGSADVKIDSIKKGLAEFGQMEGRINFANGTLSSDNVNLNVHDSPIQIRFDYASAAATPHLTLGLQSQNLNYGELLKGFGITDRVTGTGQLNLAINGFGATVRDMVASSGGAFNFTAGQGTIKQNFLRFIGADTLKILSAGSNNSDITSVRCALISAKGANGVYALSPIAADTDVMALLGKGVIDLKSETLNILLTPESNTKMQIPAYAPSLRITGSLAAPKTTADQQSIVSSITKLTDKNKNLQGFGNIIGSITGKASGSVETIDTSLNNACVSLPKTAAVKTIPDTAITPQSGAASNAQQSNIAPEAKKKKINPLDLLKSLQTN